ncbi:SIMPL domain-containing protein [Sulfurovum sp. zt1-1]|uniref:SIMPL domain-containing protein n=1 Tax=Sulfurovum zhangzhouensis TaxID=3019067 RepID=A0ABT7QUY5_9BACT|nr:SIMPL domain-containing protein [Sulfurovum zhangzhouensis]MDM5270641.1 SIMPL domain-containing protein [Sulfurovum zhangzhouensis]
MKNVFISIIVSIAIAASGYFIGQTMYNAKVAINTAEVKGLAERKVKADLVNWRLNFKVASNNKEDLSKLYSDAEKIQEDIITLLLQSGLKKEEINIGVISYSPIEFRDRDQKLVDQQHQLSNDIEIQTKKVDLISSVRSSMNKLIAKGIDINNFEPEYRFTSLNDIKPDMLKEATQNARVAANEFAQNAGIKVGSIRSAIQGNFVIRDVGEDYSDTKKIDKYVRVVTSITFYLTD